MLPYVTTAQLEKAVNEVGSKSSPEEITKIVNKAIENGDIEIPAGGTKLYKHVVTLSQASAYPSNPVDVIIISTSSTALTYADVVKYLSAPSQYSECVSIYLLGSRNFYLVVELGASIIYICSFNTTTFTYNEGVAYQYMWGSDIITAL